MNGVIPNTISRLNGLPLEHTLNLGLNGATPFVMLRNFKIYLKKYNAPERLDIVITPMMFEEYYCTAKDFEKIWLGHHQWSVLEKEGVTNSYFFPAMLFWQCLRFDQQEIFRQYHFNLLATRQSRGFQPNYENGIQGELKKNYFPRIDENFSWSQQQFNCLQEIIFLANASHTRIYFVLTPLRRDLYVQYLEKSHLFLGLEMMLKSLGPQIWLGSMDPACFNLENENFLNPDHLTNVGAEKFTRRIYASVQKHKDMSPQKLLNLLQIKAIP